jgi:ATP-dependent exoDNAse (exonuclease V) beta subunit
VRTELTFAALLPAATDERTRHDALLRGAMDRVVLYPSAAAPQRIDVYDFKTGRVPAGETPDAHAQRYAAQLQAYRAALARGYTIPCEHVRAWAVLTTCDAVCQV